MACCSAVPAVIRWFRNVLLAGRWPMSRELRWWPACCGMTTHRLLTDAELEEIERRAQAASLAPWQSFIEGRDHLSGDSFIRIGGLDDDESDMYMSRAAGSKRSPLPMPISTSSPTHARTSHA